VLGLVCSGGGFLTGDVPSERCSNLGNEPMVDPAPAGNSSITPRRARLRVIGNLRISQQGFDCLSLICRGPTTAVGCVGAIKRPQWPASMCRSSSGSGMRARLYRVAVSVGKSFTCERSESASLRAMVINFRAWPSLNGSRSQTSPHLMIQNMFGICPRNSTHVSNPAIWPKSDRLRSTLRAFWGWGKG